MGLESGTYISDLVATNPVAGDNVSQGDDHLRLLKSTIKTTFPNISGAVGAGHADLAAMGDGYSSIVWGSGVTEGGVGFVRRGVDGLCQAYLYAASALLDGQPIVTLPAGFRPANVMYNIPVFFQGVGNVPECGFVSISTSGVIAFAQAIDGTALPGSGRATTMHIYASFPTR